MIRLLLDEMFSQTIAAMVRQEDIDIVSTHERRVEGITDHDVLLIAGAERRCVITQNHRHFVPLTGEFLSDACRMRGSSHRRNRTKQCLRRYRPCHHPLRTGQPGGTAAVRDSLAQCGPLLELF